MKNSQSKFSNKKSSYENGASGTKSSTSSGCCCGAKFSEDIEELDIIEDEESK